MAKSPIERRRHKRLPISCPVMIVSSPSNEPTKARALDLSNGGVYVSAPVESVPKAGKKVAIKLFIPRTTPNTYMLEEFAVDATVLRHVALKDDSRLGLVLQFIQPQGLELEP